MGKKQKTLVLFLIFTGLLVHFSFVFINNLSFTPQKNRLQYWSDYYMYPYFLQTWQLFSPPPSANYHLIARYQKNGTQTLDVLQDIVTKHQENRLRGYEPLLISFINGIHYFEKQAFHENFKQGSTSNITNFKIVERLCYSYLYNQYAVESDKIQLTLIVNAIETKQQRVYYN